MRNHIVIFSASKWSNIKKNFAMEKDEFEHETIPMIFNSMFEEIDKSSSEYKNLKIQYQNIKDSGFLNKNRVVALFKKISSLILLPIETVEYNKKIIINWINANTKNANEKKLMPRFIMAPPDQINQETENSFSLGRAIIDLTKEYNNECLINQSLKTNVKEEEAKIQQMVKERSNLLSSIVQNKIKIYSKKEKNKAEKRNLRVISDLAYLIDQQNFDIKSKAKK